MLSESIRLQLADTNVRVIELVPPSVRTALLPGQEKSSFAMPLDEFVAEVMALLESRPGAKEIQVERVMPGLRKTDDRTFVAAFQQIDRAIINPWFMITAFGGALVLTVLVGIANRGTPALAPIAAAFGLYLVTVIITVAVNVPLNDAIKAAGDPARIDVARVRARFDEARRAAWNLVRAATSVPAFGLLAWALVLCGRANP